MRHFRSPLVVLGGIALIVSSSTTAVGAGVNSYLPTILTSDGVVFPTAPNIDPNLKNPWGFAFSTTSPFWTGNQGTGTSTLYAAGGVPNNTVGPVTIPGGGTPNGPTGVVSNAANVGGDGVTGTSFTIIGQTTPAPSSFIFADLNGTISAWNGGVGNHGTAIVELTTPGASFTGLAIANNGTQDLLYAADNASGAGHSKIDVFGQANATAAWAPVTLAGSFVNPSLPAGSNPYNIQFLNGKIYVTYQPGSVGVFDTNGNFLQNITDSHLTSPWGIALAPAGFGAFGGDLLVGNKSNGQINAFDPNSGAFLGTLLNPDGSPISFPGLWGITFREWHHLRPERALLRRGGRRQGGNIYTDGIFGEITAVPEPASAILLGLGLIVVGLCTRATSRR